MREPEVSTLSEAEDDDAPPGDGLILGLGDLVVPGMLLGLAARLDLVRKKRRRKGHVIPCVFLQDL